MLEKQNNGRNIFQTVCKHNNCIGWYFETYLKTLLENTLCDLNSLSFDIYQFDEILAYLNGRNISLIHVPASIKF